MNIYKVQLPVGGDVSGFIRTMRERYKNEYGTVTVRLMSMPRRIYIKQKDEGLNIVDMVDDVIDIYGGEYV